MTTTTPPYAWQEYEWAAEDLARQGLTGKVGDPLPTMLSVECLELINGDQEAFQRRVRECAYARAMRKVGDQ